MSLSPVSSASRLLSQFLQRDAPTPAPVQQQRATPDARARLSPHQQHQAQQGEARPRGQSKEDEKHDGNDEGDADSDAGSSSSGSSSGSTDSDQSDDSSSAATPTSRSSTRESAATRARLEELDVGVAGGRVDEQSRRTLAVGRVPLAALALHSPAPSPQHAPPGAKSSEAEDTHRRIQAQERELAYYASRSPKHSAATGAGGAPPAFDDEHARVAGPPAAVSAPSTLSLLHTIQRYHTLCSHLQQSLSHYVQSQSQSLLDLEETLQQSRFLEAMLRMVKDGPNGGGGGGGSASGHAQFPIYTAFTSTSTAQLLHHYSTNCYAILFDKRKRQTNSKPFGYAQEMEYRKLIHVIRTRPSLLAFALASFQWQLISSTAANQLSSHSPLVDPSAIGAHKRSMDSVAKCVVWDVFGCGDSSSSAAVGATSGGAGAAAATEAERKVGYTVRMTMRMMWEKETDLIKAKAAATTASQETNPVGSASQAYAAAAQVALSSPALPALPLHLLDHGAFLPKLLHEYNLLVGGAFLTRVLRDILHVVILYDDCMDLQSDLMAMAPTAVAASPTTMTTNGPLLGFEETAAAEEQRRKHSSSDDFHLPPPSSSSTDSASAAASGSIASLFRDFPPSPIPPPAASCSSSQTPPFLHGRPSSNLYDLCETLLEKLESSIGLMPIEMRRVGRELALQVYRASGGTHPSPSLGLLLPSDPDFTHPSTRLLSDYFFLNWLVNAVMFPEGYTRGLATGSLTENYPLSSLARRNLQAIGTVMIKLTSGSRFSAFAQAANGNPSDNNSPAKQQQQQASHGTPSAAVSRLDRFLEQHQSRIGRWIRRVLDVEGEEEEQEGATGGPTKTTPAVSAEDELERLESSGFEHSEFQPGVTLPAKWLAGDSTATWSSLAVSHPAADLQPILILPNDLFALHGLMKGCWNQAVQVRVASTPSRRKQMQAAAAGGGTAPPPIPVPIHKLPLPTFPRCLLAAASTATPSSSGVSGACPYPLSLLTHLLTCLASLGDVANFVPPQENTYVLLDSGFQPVKYPKVLAELREEWPYGSGGLGGNTNGGDGARLKHASDVLLSALGNMPPLPADPAQVCTKSFEQIFTALTRQHALSSHPALASQLHSTHAILSSCLPTAWQKDSFKPFLLALSATLLKQHHLLLHAKETTTRILWNYGMIQKVTEGHARKEAALVHQFKVFQLKKLLELTRPKIRRLKKFLATKTDPRAAAATTTASGAPVHQQAQGAPNGSPTSLSALAAATAATAADLPQCAGQCPDNPAQDRFLCSLCSRLLERRRGLLKSFMNKYVIGEGLVVVSSAPAHHAHHQQQQQTMIGGGPNAGPGASVASINAFAVPESNGQGGAGSAPLNSSQSLFVSVGTGPPLDIREASIACDIQDYILSSAYPELFVKCTKADDAWHGKMTRLSRFFEHNFLHFYTYMQFLDLFPSAPSATANGEATLALEQWKEWRSRTTLSDFVDEDEEEETTAAAASSPDPDESMEGGENGRPRRRASTSPSSAQKRAARPPASSSSSSSPFHDPMHLGLAGHAPITVQLPGGKVKTIYVPYLGTHAIGRAYQLLRTLDAEVKPKKKLDVCIDVRALLLGTLGTASFTSLSSISRAPASSADALSPTTTSSKLHSKILTMSPFSTQSASSSSSHPAAGGSFGAPNFHPLHPSNDAASIPDDVEAGSVEDYMSALCYTLMLANSPFFVSNIQFLKSLFATASNGCKGFVDCIVAMRYLDGIWATLAPTILAEEQRERDRLERLRVEKEKREAIREAQRRMEAELAAQAEQLSREIQAEEARAMEEDRRKRELEIREHVLRGQDQDDDEGDDEADEQHDEDGSDHQQEGDSAHAGMLRMDPLTHDASSSGASPTAHPLASTPAVIHQRLLGMGYSEADASDAVRLFSSGVSVPTADEQLACALDFLTTLHQLTDGGWDRTLVVQVAELLGLRELTPEMVVTQLEANGFRRRV